MVEQFVTDVILVYINTASNQTSSRTNISRNEQETRTRVYIARMKMGAGRMAPHIRKSPIQVSLITRFHVKQP